MHHNFFLFHISNVIAVKLTLMVVLNATSLLFEVVTGRVEVCTDDDML